MELELILIYAYFMMLSVLLVYSVEAFYLSLKFKSNYIDKEKEVTPALQKDLPLVTIQLPIFNEKYVLERLMESISKIDYPQTHLDIQILDDSTDESQYLCSELAASYRNKGFDVEHIHRKNREGYKAGALKNGLLTAKGEFVAIFDADFLPKPDFMKQTIPFFQNSEIGLVQSRWKHLNRSYSPLTEAQAIALDNHFVVEQTARNRSGYFINFNGTGGVWRKQTIYDAGNWQADTITEDLDLSFRAQLLGWKFKYLVDYETPSELPAEINAFKSQQYRWTKGAVETARKLLPRVWKSHLSIKEKVQCTYHLTNNIVYIAVFFLAILNLPMIYIKTEMPEYNIYFLILSVFSISFVGPMLMVYFAQNLTSPNWKRNLIFIPVFLSGTMGLAVNNCKAVLEALIGKKSEFVRTPKFNIFNKTDKWKTKTYKAELSAWVFVELLMALYTFVGLSIAVVNLEIAAIPFHAMFCFGFSMMSFLTLKHHFQQKMAGKYDTVATETRSA